MNYEILEHDHIVELIDLYIEAFNAPPWHDKWTSDTVFNRLSQMMNCEGAYGLVAYKDEKVVGMILGNHEYYYNGMQFQIKEFCVDHKLKGEGIGSKLFDEFLGRLKERGIGEVMLLTSRTEKTEGFYNKRGFESSNDMTLMGKKI